MIWLQQLERSKGLTQTIKVLEGRMSCPVMLRSLVVLSSLVDIFLSVRGRMALD